MAPIAGWRRTSRRGRDGAIAQLGERVVRNDEVGGSIPPGSTTLRLRLRVAQPRQPNAKRARHSPKGDDGLAVSENGAIAQLGERVLCKHEVVGSIPSGSTRWN